jgi:hypothetical protein
MSRNKGTAYIWRTNIALQMIIFLKSQIARFVDVLSCATYLRTPIVRTLYAKRPQNARTDLMLSF